MLPREHFIKQPYYGINDLKDTASLTSAQIRLIKKHGCLINALLQDEVLNPNFADLQILKAINGKNAPTNPVVHAWQKYTQLKQSQITLKNSA
ncbi:DUF413 domain-containing protein [Gilvimarinus agarilyticus]|uniref:DUF413 domain-containing protein n=1 Tax=unclassified Gilvimarinus TaxID=2642066 RepID=UPI001C0923F1|nr:MULTISPECIES: DUF413 domain-containing protein [unclassified Gilvimarinus]MBU2886950.1 DUF413 domain-containing protein [Gilvimarinus agarilyticus]MDO6571610.1 DUF413 domain-containing protein [Gilvimarinus sp. 2_MG-2023]MDO6747867.1 DUF413 domain-containing protein [Gilvimarinus sp. 1_MG-2023]